MPTPINIPKLGAAMTEGTLSSWMAPDGTHVTKGQVIYVLETEKVENEIEAPATGTLHHIGSEGELYPIGTTIAEITEP
jgi:pyruvate/2-oxoglutarate dehydrogenase complex dihydrolipoamide acyltransferase (E2) component